MPLPTKRKGEDRKKFIARCMSNPQTKKDFPDQKQRTAVCFSRSKRSKGDFTSEELEALATMLPIGNRGKDLDEEKAKKRKKFKRKKDKFRLVRDEEVGSSVTGQDKDKKKKKKKKKTKVY